MFSFIRLTNFKTRNIQTANCLWHIGLIMTTNEHLAATGVDLRVVVCVKELLLGRSQRVRVDGQLSEEVRVTSGVLQGSTLGPLLFLTYVNDIWRNNGSNIRLFTEDCITYRKIMDSGDTDNVDRPKQIRGMGGRK